MGFDQDLQDAANNVDRSSGQAKFRGNDNNKIEQEINEYALLDMLSTYKKAHGVGSQVHTLVAILAGTPWKVTAAIHKGGLGGVAGAADPRRHITLSTGHHIRLGKKGDLIKEITGPAIEPILGRAAAQATLSAAAAAAAAGSGGSAPPAGVSYVEWISASFGTSAYQAAKAKKMHDTGGGTYAACAEKAKSMYPGK